MRQAAGEGDASAESAADAEFHATIVRAANNAVLRDQWEQLLPHARTFISLTLPSLRPRRSRRRHVPIMQALRRHDPHLAEAAMYEHLADVADRMRRLVAAPTEKEAP